MHESAQKQDVVYARRLRLGNSATLQDIYMPNAGIFARSRRSRVTSTTLPPRLVSWMSRRQGTGR